MPCPYPKLKKRWLVGRRFFLGADGSLRDEYFDPFRGGPALVHESLRVASVAMFLLMPLAALLLLLAYRHQQRHYLGHLVFTIHLHCVLFVLIMLGIPFELIKLDAVGTWLPVLIGPYLLLALRRVYAQGWGKTTAKTLLLAATYFVLLGIAIFAGTILYHGNGIIRLF